jgi:hypothetical protein
LAGSGIFDAIPENRLSPCRPATEKLLPLLVVVLALFIAV